MAKQSLRLKIANPLLTLLLRSPWHWVASGSILLITVTGRQSGRRYTTPVNFVPEEGQLLVLSHQHRTWWRNLRGGAAVTIRWRGKKINTTATVVEEAAQVTPYFERYLTAVPQYAPAFDVKLAENNTPLSADVERATAGKVIVVIRAEEKNT
jgi:deazaflavin-dependent oxidoreductase (nitroreductase family)